MSIFCKHCDNSGRPCPYCEIENLKARIKELEEAVKEEYNLKEDALVRAEEVEQSRQSTLDHWGKYKQGYYHELERAEAAEARVKELEEEVNEIHATGGTSYIRLEKSEAESQRLREALKTIARNSYNEVFSCGAFAEQALKEEG